MQNASMILHHPTNETPIFQHGAGSEEIDPTPRNWCLVRRVKKKEFPFANSRPDRSAHRLEDAFGDDRPRPVPAVASRYRAPGQGSRPDSIESA